MRKLLGIVVAVGLAAATACDLTGPGFTGDPGVREAGDHVR